VRNFRTPAFYVIRIVGVLKTSFWRSETREELLQPEAHIADGAGIIAGVEKKTGRAKQPRPAFSFLYGLKLVQAVAVALFLVRLRTFLRSRNPTTAIPAQTMLNNED
jgi:hypothetical protein